MRYNTVNGELFKDMKGNAYSLKDWAPILGGPYLFDCQIFWPNGKHARIPLTIQAIEYYRSKGVQINAGYQYY